MVNLSLVCFYKSGWISIFQHVFKFLGLLGGLAKFW
jgi:hypothetical protein